MQPKYLVYLAIKSIIDNNKLFDIDEKISKDLLLSLPNKCIDKIYDYIKYIQYLKNLTRIHERIY